MTVLTDGGAGLGGTWEVMTVGMDLQACRRFGGLKCLEPCCRDGADMKQSKQFGAQKISLFQA